jgi:hypothetical protein
MRWLAEGLITTANFVQWYGDQMKDWEPVSEKECSGLNAVNGSHNEDDPKRMIERGN